MIDAAHPLVARPRGAAPATSPAWCATTSLTMLDRPERLGGDVVGVSDGIRTRGHLDHNQVLYQLSYTHHVRPWGAAQTSVSAQVSGWITRFWPSPDEGDSVPGATGSAPVDVAAACADDTEPPNRSASALASSEAGPGCPTNTAAR